MLRGCPCVSLPVPLCVAASLTRSSATVAPLRVSQHHLHVQAPFPLRYSQALPGSRDAPIQICPARGSRSSRLAQGLYGQVDVVPPDTIRKTPTIIEFSGFGYTASMLAAYGSFRPYGTTTQCSFPAGGLPCRAGLAPRRASIASFLKLRFHGSQCTALCLARRVNPCVPWAVRPGFATSNSIAIISMSRAPIARFSA